MNVKCYIDHEDYLNMNIDATLTISYDVTQFKDDVLSGNEIESSANIDLLKCTLPLSGL